MRYRALRCSCGAKGCSSWLVEGPGLCMTQGAIHDEGTARLIEAAPTMLAAIRELFEGPPGDGDNDGMRKLVDLYEQLKEVQL